jgi:hypothetical protein
MGAAPEKDAAEPKGPWYQEIRWSSVITLIFIPLYGFIQALWVPLTLKTLQWSLVYYVATMVAVTAGKQSFLKSLTLACIFVLIKYL